MSNKDQVRRLLQKKLAQKQNLISAVSGLLGDGSGNVTDTSKTNHVFVRISGIVTSVFNVKVPPENDLRVLVGNDPAQPNLTQVLSTFTSSPGGTTGGGVVGYAPASQYEWMGPDPIFIDKRLILPRRISTYSGMQVKIYADMFWTGTDWISIPIIPDPIDLSDYIPATAGKVAIVLITLNTAGETVLTDGADVDIADLAPADVPAVPEDTSDVLAAVRVYYGQTAVKEMKTNTDIVDLRFTYFGSGGSDVIANHDHSGDAGDGGTFDAANLTSGAANDNYVLTADGSGGVTWEDGGSGGSPNLDGGEADSNYGGITAIDGGSA
jgi:hypothetical protein